MSKAILISVRAPVFLVVGAVSLIASAALGVTVVRGQGTTQPPAPAGIGAASIVGTVVEAESNRPVPTAVVSLARRDGPFSSLAVLTDANGRFAFLDLPKGSFDISADKDGYWFAGYGQWRIGGRPQAFVLAENQHATGVTIRIWKQGVITGTVTDEAGEPAVGVAVTALAQDFVGGKPTVYTPSATTKTDDRGVYRLPRLTPGDYFVAAAFRQFSIPAEVVTRPPPTGPTPDRRSPGISRELMTSRGTDARPGMPGVLQFGDQLQLLIGAATPPPPADGRWSVYATTYHPAGASADDARIVTVRSGEEQTGIDLALRPVASQKVSGIVVGPDGPVAGATLRLNAVTTRRFALGPEIAVTFSDSRGAFVFPALPRGSYTLSVLELPPSDSPNSGLIMASSAAEPELSRAMATVSPFADRPTLWTSMPVSVGDRDVTDISVTLRRGARIRGRVEFDQQGAAAKPRVSVTIDRADGRQLDAVSFTPAAVNAENLFQTIELPAGKYFVSTQAFPGGWALKSVMLAGRDLSIDPLDLAATDIEGIVITLTDHPSEIRGTIRNAQNAVDPDASALLFPAEQGAWVDFGRSPRRLVDARANLDGVFTLRGVPAGDYMLVAVPDARARSWKSPAMLEVLARSAMRIHISDGQSVTQDLKTVAIR